MSEESLGKCPLCKEGDIIEKEKNFVCSKANWTKDENDKWENKGCSYSIYKFGLQKFGKDEIKAEEVRQMLENHEFYVELISKRKMIPDDKYGVKILFKEQ